MQRAGLCTIVLFCFSVVAAVEVFVATDGNDNWSGLLPQPNAQLTDGPVATITRAQVLLQALKVNETTVPSYISIRGGTYRLNKTLVIAGKDSGFSQSAPTVYRAFNGEKPVFLGSVQVTGWQLLRNDSNFTNGVWYTDFFVNNPNISYFYSMFVNGERRSRARNPNSKTDYLYWARAFLSKQQTTNGRELTGREGFFYRPGDINPSWHDIDNVMVVVYAAWTDSHHWIASINSASNMLNFTVPADYVLSYQSASGKRYYVENVREALDFPGEWYFDGVTRRLYYLPLPTENLNDPATSVEVPLMTHIVSFAGTPLSPVQFVDFENLTFQYTDWTVLQRRYYQDIDQQASSFPAMSAAMVVSSSSNCRFTRLEVSHTGMYALQFSQHVTNCAVIESHFYDTGSGGVRIGSMDSNTVTNITVDNCYIHDGGHVWQSGVGILVQRNSNNTITNNEICDYFYSGISVGWNWDYTLPNGFNNFVYNNKIHHIGKGVLSDMAGIYTLGISDQTIIEQNHISRVYTFEYGGHGMYPDQASANQHWNKNIVHDVKSNPFFCNYGTNLTVTNNILITNHNPTFSLNQYLPATGVQLRSFINITNNLAVIFYPTVYARQLSTAGQNPLALHADYNFFTNNLTCPGNNEYFVGNRNLSAWQQFLGQDNHSLEGDPQFTNFELALQGKDFSLLPTSPVLSLGFQPPAPVNTIGLTSAYQRHLAATQRLSMCSPLAQLIVVNDNYEDWAIGEIPNRANYVSPSLVSVVSIPPNKKVLRFYDYMVGNNWDPSISWNNGQVEEGVIDVDFDVLIEQGSRYHFEMRQYTEGTYISGPLVLVASSGQIRGSSNVDLMPMPVNDWVHIHIEYGLGSQNTKSYNLSVTSLGVVTNFTLPIISPLFCRFNWAGFQSSSSSISSYYLDNLSIRPRPPTISISMNNQVETVNINQSVTVTASFADWDGSIDQICSVVFKINGYPMHSIYSNLTSGTVSHTFGPLVSDGILVFAAEVTSSISGVARSNQVQVTVNPPPGPTTSAATTATPSSTADETTPSTTATPPTSPATTSAAVTGTKTTSNATTQSFNMLVIVVACVSLFM